MIELLGAIATALAITGVVLNNSMMIWCFPIWFLSNGITAWIHYKKRVRSLLVRDLVFMALAVAGWVQWSA
jgi:nicotinamide riboside transporter PnuC